MHLLRTCKTLLANRQRILSTGYAQLQQLCTPLQISTTKTVSKEPLMTSTHPSNIHKEVWDGLNYGLYCPPGNGRAGKFLDEERRLEEYPLPELPGYLESWDIFFKNSVAGKFPGLAHQTPPQVSTVPVQMFGGGAPAVGAPQIAVTTAPRDIEDHLSVQAIIRSYQAYWQRPAAGAKSVVSAKVWCQVRGHLVAKIDPLNMHNPITPDGQTPTSKAIVLHNYNLEEKDMDRQFKLPATTFIGGKESVLTLLEILKRLEVEKERYEAVLQEAFRGALAEAMSFRDSKIDKAAQREYEKMRQEQLSKVKSDFDEKLKHHKNLGEELHKKIESFKDSIKKLK